MGFFSLSDVSSPGLSDEGGKYQKIGNIGHGMVARRRIATGRDQMPTISAEDVHISLRFGILAQSVPELFQEHPLPIQHSIMANPEHLAILKQGVEIWNQWREGTPEIQPDLSYSDLCRKNLDWVNFSGVNLFGADLSETSLMGADVVAAYLVNTT